MKRINLIQIGIGTVGGEVIAQIIANRARWHQELGLEITVAGIAGTEGALPGEDIAGLSDAALQAAVTGRRGGQGLTSAAGGRSLVPTAELISRTIPSGPTVVLDAAAGEHTAPVLGRALAEGAGVVLSNKAPLALPLSNPLAAELWAAAGPKGNLRYEATCGAGLPVISTLRGLLDTGDQPIELQGALSGTFGAIFSDLARNVPFSAAVRDAKDRGYTEPDPRDDLSGLDVARKALILARTLGRQVDLSDIEVQSLVPDNLREVPVPEFLEQISEQDFEVAAMVTKAKANNAALKYVATVPATGPIAVGMRQVPLSGVLGALQGPENVVSMRTARYDAYPLTVAGPGAGAAVTAAGMLTDMLVLALR